jgi:hypothetical protein
MNNKLRAISFMFLIEVCFIFQTEKTYSQRTFALRHTAFNIKGDVTIIGNRVMTGASAIKNNDGTTMSNIDLDGNATTTLNSSSADLSLPAGAVVQWAGLYWAARSLNANRTKIKFKATSDVYTTYTATQFDNGNTISDLVGENHYQGFIDVTTYIQSKGSTTYWGGDVQTTTGNDGTGFYGGWSLIVVYTDVAQPLRNITVFDGYNAVYSSSVTINVSGFLTPSASGFTTKIGIVAWEGDLYNTGDKMRLNSNTAGNEVSNAANPSTNFFNSTISSSAARNPNTTNNFGVDFDYITSNIALPTNATSTNVYFITSGDLYMPGAMVFTTDVNPIILPVELTSFKVSCKNNYNELQWETASEHNNDFFSVQRSKNGKDFEDVAKIKGHGTTSIASTFTWQDWNSSSDSAFYRLKQTDFNGDEKIAKTVFVNCNTESHIDKNEITIFPNPFSGKIKITSKNTIPAGTTLCILNNFGETVFKEAVLKQSNLIECETRKNLPPGNYFLILRNESGIISKNILQKF